MSDGTAPQNTSIDFKQRIACKAVVVRDGKALILREATTYDEGTNIGKYGLPGGRIHPGEPFMDGLLREVREETGLVVQVAEPMYVGEWFPEIKGVKHQIVAIFFACTSADGNVKLSEEHDAYEWVDVSRVKHFNLMPPDDLVLEKYFGSQSLRE